MSPTETADSLASLGGVSGGGVGVGGGGVNNDDDDDEDAEFEVRVIANRANVNKDGNDDDSHHRIQVLHNNEDVPPSSIAACTTTASTTPQQQGTGARTGEGGGGGRRGGEAGKPKRLQSLDILRGITIIFHGPSSIPRAADPFDQLAHTPWFGYTLADWVFPNFIFMVGMAVAIVLSPTKLVTLSRSSDNHLLQLQQSGCEGDVETARDTDLDVTQNQCTAQSVLDTWLFTKDRDPNNPIFDGEGTLGDVMAVVTAWVGWMVGWLVAEQQRMWKGVLKGVVEDFERETEAERKWWRGKRLEPWRQSLSLPLTRTTTNKTRNPPTPYNNHQRTHLLSHLGEWFMLGICTSSPEQSSDVPPNLQIPMDP
ncbi:hypothetical protein BKA57DRAFT_511600 [Linnemannia elongata]|nr:hypothetical protein BKA57DRAFT_511600 [Linnemannia elongata]